MELKQIERILKDRSTRLDSLEAAVAKIKGRLRFWQLAAFAGFGLAALFFWLSRRHGKV